jgi:hypothetical protein
MVKIWKKLMKAYTHLTTQQPATIGLSTATTLQQANQSFAAIPTWEPKYPHFGNFKS